MNLIIDKAENVLLVGWDYSDTALAIKIPGVELDLDGILNLQIKKIKETECNIDLISKEVAEDLIPLEVGSCTQIHLKSIKDIKKLINVHDFGKSRLWIVVNEVL